MLPSHDQDGCGSGNDTFPPLPPGDVEHEHAPDTGCDEISPSSHGEEESEDCSFLQTLNCNHPKPTQGGGGVTWVSL